MAHKKGKEHWFTQRVEEYENKIKELQQQFRDEKVSKTISLFEMAIVATAYQKGEKYFDNALELMWNLEGSDKPEFLRRFFNCYFKKERTNTQ